MLHDVGQSQNQKMSILYPSRHGRDARSSNVLVHGGGGGTKESPNSSVQTPG